MGSYGPLVTELLIIIVVWKSLGWIIRALKFYLTGNRR